MNIGTLTGAITLEDQMSSVLMKVNSLLTQFEGTTTGSLMKIATASSFLGNIFAGWISKFISFTTNLVTNSLMAGAKLEQLGGVTRFLGERAGYTGAEIDALSDKIQRTGITGLESRNAIQKLLGAHIDLKYATELSAVAQNMATISGAGSSETYGRIIRAVTTLNPKILQSAGFTTTMSKAMQDYTAATGKSADALGPLEKRQTLITAILKEGAEKAGLYGLSLEYAAKQAGSAERAWSEVSEVIGTILLPITSAALKAWYALGQGVRDVIRDNASTIESGMKSMGDSVKGALLVVSQWFIKGIEAAIQYGPTIIGVIVQIKDTIAYVIYSVQAAWDVLPDWLKNVATTAILSGVALYGMSIAATSVSNTFTSMLGIVANISTTISALPLVFGKVAQVWTNMVGPGTKVLNILTSVADVSSSSKMIHGMGQMGKLAAVGQIGATVGSGVVTGAGVSTAAPAAGALLAGGAFATATAAVIAFTASLAALAVVAAAGYLWWKNNQNEQKIAADATEQSARTMQAAMDLAGHGFASEADALKYLNTHVKDHAAGIVKVREHVEYLTKAEEAAAKIAKEKLIYDDAALKVGGQRSATTLELAAAEAYLKDRQRDSTTGIVTMTSAYIKQAEIDKNILDYDKMKAVAADHSVENMAKSAAATTWLSERQKDARTGIVEMTDAYKKLHPEVKEVVEATTEETQHLQAVSSIVTSVRVAVMGVTTTTEAWNQALAANNNVLDYSVEAAAIWIPKLDAMINSGGKLTEVQKNYYIAISKSRVETEAMAVVDTELNGLTLDLIDSLKAQGYSLAEIAVRYDTTAAAAGKLEAQERSLLAARRKGTDLDLGGDTLAKSQLKITNDLIDLLKTLPDTIKGQEQAVLETNNALKEQKALVTDINFLHSASKEGLQQVATNALNTYNEMLLGNKTYTEATIANQKMAAAVAQAAVGGQTEDVFKLTRAYKDLAVNVAQAMLNDEIAGQMSGAIAGNTARVYELRDALQAAKEAAQGYGTTGVQAMQNVQQAAQDAQKALLDAWSAKAPFDVTGKTIASYEQYSGDNAKEIATLMNQGLTLAQAIDTAEAAAIKAAQVAEQVAKRSEVMTSTVANACDCSTSSATASSSGSSAASSAKYASAADSAVFRSQNSGKTSSRGGGAWSGGSQPDPGSRGVAVTNHIYVNDTLDRAAVKIAAKIMDSAKTRRQWS